MDGEKKRITEAVNRREIGIGVAVFLLLYTTLLYFSTNQVISPFPLPLYPVTSGNLTQVDPGPPGNLTPDGLSYGKAGLAVETQPDTQNNPPIKPFEVIEASNDSETTEIRTKTTWKYKSRRIEQWKNDSLTLDMPAYRPGVLTKIRDTDCFNRGTLVKMSKALQRCVCRRDYFGENCGIPGSVWFGSLTDKEKRLLKLRSTPRRIVSALIVNHEFEFFEARIKDHFDEVDVFLILESRFTAHGDAKAPLFFPKLQAGWLSDYQHKMFHVYLDFFHEKGRSDGWFADGYPRVYLGEQGLPRLHGLEPEDIIIYNDADEIPNRSTIEFLKYYEGYAEPIAFNFRWTIFGYYWLSTDSSGNEQLTQVTGAASWQLVHHVFNNNIWEVRQFKDSSNQQSAAEHNVTIGKWTIGDIGHYAGFHCSWCFSTPDIQNKLKSAQSEDKPRWGDYADRLDPDFIDNLRETGTWFDKKGKFNMVEFAPHYVLQNYAAFRSLLVPPEAEEYPQDSLDVIT